MAQSLRGDLDFVTLKTSALAHQSRLGRARLFRVRTSDEMAEKHAAFARAVNRQLEAEAYDVVHVRGATEGEVAIRHRASMGFRFVYEVATFPDEAEGPVAERTWAEAHARCLEHADLILVGAEAAARALGEQGHAGKVAVVPPGVDVDAYDWWPSFATDTLRLLYLGSFGQDRDVPTLLGALRAVAQNSPIRVLLAGEPLPERRAQTRRLVRSFGLESCVTVRGEPRAVAIPSMIAACDVALVTASAAPRFQELGELPDPLLEYLACRRAVVAAGVPAVAEVIRDEVEGLLYTPGEEDTLADAILTLARDVDHRRAIMEAGYERVRQRFSSGARRRRIAEVYEMLAPGSQSYDAWEDGFGDGEGSAPITGLQEIPSAPTPLPNEPTPMMRDRDPATLRQPRPALEGSITQVDPPEK